jgi:hypothetical protein
MLNLVSRSECMHLYSPEGAGQQKTGVSLENNLP